VDIQVNGYAGLDFNGDPSEWTGGEFHRVADLLSARGIVAVLPTFITSERCAMLDRAKRYRSLVDADGGLERRFPKLHIEGPFISSADGPRGAHRQEYCRRPSDMPDFIDRLQDASGGRVGIVTLAPELPGAEGLILKLAEAGICSAIGHTQAGTDDIDRAVRAGAKLSTHLGNGSHLELPRLDNYVQAQLANDRLSASFIPDGYHMPFATLKNFIRAKTPARSVLVSDAISAAELPPGRYDLGGRAVVVRQDGKCMAPDQSCLSGSTLSLDRGVVNVASACGVTFAEAWAMASTNPARLVGLDLPENVTVTVTKAGLQRY